MSKRENNLLEEQIAARRKEVKDKKIDEKAVHVARYLGRERSLNEKGMTGHAYAYEDHGLKISHESGSVSSSDGDAGFVGTEISYNSVSVYTQGGGQVTRYIPGFWESILEVQYIRARAREKEIGRETTKNRSKAKAKKTRELRENWGL